MALPDDVKMYVKQYVVQTLGTEARPSSAAQCISAIAAVEMPLGQWVDIINILKTNVTTEENSEQLKEASLETLGYICQALPPSCMEAFANNVLTSIIFGMRQAETSIHVKLAATNALLNSLEFTHMNFQNEVSLLVLGRVSFFLLSRKNAMSSWNMFAEPHNIHITKSRW